MKKIFPPTHFYTYLIISVLLHFTFPIKQIINSPVYFLGIVFIAAGIILNLLTDKIFKDQKTTVKPDQKPTMLIDYGPFKISRNPMCLGMLLFLFGTGIFLGSISSFIGAVFFIGAMELFFIPDEEKLMSDVFGEDYENYKKKVRRWI